MALQPCADTQQCSVPKAQHAAGAHHLACTRAHACARTYICTRLQACAKLPPPCPPPLPPPSQRVLKNDFMKFTRDADREAGEDPDESGWKYLHGDVFRWGGTGTYLGGEAHARGPTREPGPWPPCLHGAQPRASFGSGGAHKPAAPSATCNVRLAARRFPQDINLFSAMVGVGTQVGGRARACARRAGGRATHAPAPARWALVKPWRPLKHWALHHIPCPRLSHGQVLVIVLTVFLLALMDMFYPYNRGAMLSACVVLYALTAGVSGAQGRAAGCNGCQT